MAEDDDSAARAVSDAVRRDSERLLRAVDELRAMEREKRGLAISSRTFHELAERVEQKAREVFRLAGEEEDDGLAADRPTAPHSTSADELIDRHPNGAGAGNAPDRA
jgi:signal transduction histidine kinase